MAVAITEDDMRKTLQIRHYLIGEIYRAGKSSVKLPSVRELAKQFTVAPCTVSAVTAELIRDGWLRSRRGLGIFTNPEKIADDTEAGLIGVINGDGCLYYFNRDVFDSFTAIGKAIFAHKFNFRNIMLDSADADEMVREVERQPLRGLIWNAGTVVVSEEPAIRLSKSGLPIVADCPQWERIDVVCSEYGMLGNFWADCFRKNPNKRPLLYLPEWHCLQLLQWMPKEMTDVVHPGQENPSKTYDIIVTDAPHLRQIKALQPLAEVHEWNVLDDGIHWVPDYRRIADFMMERLLRLMKGEKMFVEKALIPLKPSR